MFFKISQILQENTSWCQPGYWSPIENHNPAIFSVLQALKNLISLPRQTKSLANSNVLHMFNSNPYWFQNSPETHLNSKLCCSSDLTEPKSHKLNIKSPLTKATTLLKRDSTTGVFLWNLQNVWEHLFWRTLFRNCENCF